MRREPTPFEVILWRSLSRSQLGGFKFRRQAVIGTFICDFACPLVRLAVEVDGVTHSSEKDAARDAALAGYGYRVLHFTNEEVRDNLDGVLTAIRIGCENR